MTVRSHLDVGRLQIPMDDALFVSSLKRLRDLFRDRQRLIERNGTPRDAIRERRSFDEFQHKCLGAVRIFEPVDRRNVRMIQRREDLRFTLEARESFRIVGDYRQQDFDRDLSMQLRVAGTVHGAHSPGAERGRDLVRAEAIAGSQCREQVREV